ncbi:hypothetical protein [Cutibacterium avidum]|uniref:FDXHR family putative zinc-binding protein n=1 Tax=Cutibacterium avidum TaxID=33010 RepID=UPI003B001F8E
MNFTCPVCHDQMHGSRTEHCRVCHQTFASTTAGDMHRKGDHGVTAGPNRRRCLTADEMIAKGMARNADGYWTSGITMSAEAIAARQAR